MLSTISSVQFSHSVLSNSLWPQGLHHARPPCPSPTPRAYWNSCPLSQWCYPTISSSVIPFSSRLQSFPASGLFWWVSSLHQVAKVLELPASASVLPMNIQVWFPLGLTGLISLLSKRLWRVFSSSTIQNLHSRWYMYKCCHGVKSDFFFLNTEFQKKFLMKSPK